MRVGVLGPVVLGATDGGTVMLTPRKAREVLAVLAFEHPRSVSVDALVDALWDDPPPAAVKTVQAHLSRIRQALRQAGASPPGVAGGPTGYRLSAGIEVDLAVVEKLIRSGRRTLGATGWSLARGHADQGLTLFRGAPELPDTVACAPIRARVDDLRVELGELGATASLLGGDTAAALAELELLLDEFPLREHLWLVDLVALAQAGRFADALRAHALARATLGDELGIEPGVQLRDAEADLLAGRVPALPTTRHPSRRDPPRDHVRADPPRVRVQFVGIDRLHIAHCSIGTGPDLVLLNPGTLPSDCILTEPRLAAAIGELAKTLRVTWFDRRGVGLSDRCSADQLPSIDDWVRDLLAVLDATAAPQAVLLATEDTVPIAVHAAGGHPERVAGLVLVNAYPRFTSAPDYPHGFDPSVADDSAADVTAATPPNHGLDLLSVIAPSVANDRAFRAWWDDAGRRGASPNVARALRTRHTRLDLRDLLPGIAAPVLHLVSPAAVAHDSGHDRYLAATVPNIRTIELPGSDELWWLEPSGIAVSHITRFALTSTSGSRSRRDTAMSSPKEATPGWV